MPTQIQIDVAISEINPVAISMRSALDVLAEAAPDQRAGYRIIRPGETGYVTVDANHSAVVEENSGAFTATPLSRPVNGSAAKGTLQNVGQAKVTGDFTGTASSATFAPPPNGIFNVNLTGTFDATVLLEKSIDNGSNWTTAATYTTPQNNTITDTTPGVLYRFRCSVFTSGTVTYRISTGANVTQALYLKARSAARAVDANYGGNFSVNYGGQPNPYPPPAQADAQQSTAALTLDAGAAIPRTQPGNYYLLTGT